MKKVYKNLSLSLISLFVFIIIAELLTRLLWHPVEEDIELHKGIILKGTKRNFTYEGVEYSTNSYGIRNKELKPDKDTNTVRIMALGDSFVWGEGLHNDELVTIKLEKYLEKKTEEKFEVINTGIGGFNTRDEYNQLIRLFPIYNPDIVIQFFFTNDILDVNGQGEIEDKKVVYHMWLRKHSKFYSLLYYLIKNTINAKVSFPQFLLPQDYFNLDSTKSGWVSFKENTNNIKQYCKSKNASLFFVLIPTLTNLDENYPYKELTEKVTDFVLSQKINFLSYFRLFSKYKPVELWVGEENTHWNGRATSLAAKELGDFILKKEGLNLKYQN